MTSFMNRYKSGRALFALTAIGTLALGGMAEAARLVELKNMVARVIVEPQAREDVDLKVDYNGQSLPKITVRTNGDKLVADGQLNLRGDNGLVGDSVKINGQTRMDLKDLPTVRILVPMDVQIAASRGIYMGEVGKVQNLNLDLDGQGTWTLSDVEGEARIVLKGRDNLKAGQVQTLGLKVSGAGNVEIERLTGPARIALDGAGEVLIRDGQTPRLEVGLNGAGQLRYEGVAHDVDLNVIGTGNISVRKVTGMLRKRIEGEGAINIGH